MIRIVSLLAVPALAFFTVSCGCPQEVSPPDLPKEPKFKELPSADDIGGPVEVVPTK